MDSQTIEEQYDVTVVTDPTDANLLYDSVDDTFHRFLSWAVSSDAYHTKLPNGEKIVIVRKYLHSSNRYYFVVSESFQDYE